MKESKIQKKIINYLEKLWFITIKITVSNFNGIPDILVLTGNWKHFWCEVKTLTGKESVLQQYRRKKFREHGDISIVVYGYEDFIIQYTELWITSNIKNI